MIYNSTKAANVGRRCVVLWQHLDKHLSDRRYVAYLFYFKKQAKIIHVEQCSLFWCFENLWKAVDCNDVSDEMLGDFTI